MKFCQQDCLDNTVYSNLCYIRFFFRLFQVTLRQDAQSVFTDDVVFENSLGPINFKTDSVYSGFLEGNFFNGGTFRPEILIDEINTMHIYFIVYCYF